MRVLLVDDEPRVVEALERILDVEIDGLELVTATSGAQALEELDLAPCDLLITDMRMPNMNGAELLEQVHGRWPQVVRFVLSGQMEPEASVRAWPHAHQFLTKPCPTPVLLSAVEGGRRLRDLVAADAVRDLAAQLASVPAGPARFVDPGRFGAVGAQALMLEERLLRGLDPVDRDELHRRAIRTGLRSYELDPTPEAFAAGLLAHAGSWVADEVGAMPADQRSKLVAGLFAMWGLPGVLVEAIAHHPEPDAAPVEARRLAAVVREAVG